MDILIKVFRTMPTPCLGIELTPSAFIKKLQKFHPHSPRQFQFPPHLRVYINEYYITIFINIQGHIKFLDAFQIDVEKTASTVFPMETLFSISIWLPMANFGLFIEGTASFTQC